MHQGLEEVKDPCSWTWMIGIALDQMLACRFGELCECVMAAPAGATTGDDGSTGRRNHVVVRVRHPSQ